MDPMNKKHVHGEDVEGPVLLKRTSNSLSGVNIQSDSVQPPPPTFKRCRQGSSCPVTENLCDDKETAIVAKMKKGDRLVVERYFNSAPVMIPSNVINTNKVRICSDIEVEVTKTLGNCEQTMRLKSSMFVLRTWNITYLMSNDDGCKPIVVVLKSSEDLVLVGNLIGKFLLFLEGVETKITVPEMIGFLSKTNMMRFFGHSLSVLFIADFICGLSPAKMCIFQRLFQDAEKVDSFLAAYVTLLSRLKIQKEIKVFQSGNLLNLIPASITRCLWLQEEREFAAAAMWKEENLKQCEKVMKLFKVQLQTDTRVDTVSYDHEIKTSLVSYEPTCASKRAALLPLVISQFLKNQIENIPFLMFDLVLAKTSLVKPK